MSSRRCPAMAGSFTKQDVLDFLDRCVIHNRGFLFMDLEHGYFYTANSRLSLYADSARWAIVFEKSGYANRGFRIELEPNYFGNCLSNLEHGGLYYQFNYNAKQVILVEWESLNEICADFEDISTTATHVKLRDQLVLLPSSLEDWAKWVPEMRNRDAGSLARFEDLARYLAYEHSEVCRATDREKRQCIPADLPLIMTIDEWHHRSYCYYENGPDKKIMGDAPSNYETFPLVADVLCTRDPSVFRPTLAANNHWSNWPEAGSL